MHLRSLKDLTTQQLHEIIDYALYIKKNPHKFENALHRQSLLMLFQKTSTRTRVSFEVAMTQLGGHAIFLDWNMSNFTLSDIQDEARYLSRNVNIIMARLTKHADLLTLADYSSVPVINGCCEKFHPCQVISDLVTIQEKRGSYSDLHLVFVGVHNNVCNSLILAAEKLGFALTLVTAEQHAYSLDHDIAHILTRNPKIHHSQNLQAALSDAHIVYTDTWQDMDSQYWHSQEHHHAYIERMQAFQLNHKTLHGFKGLIMHDMPIHTGFEITRELVESEQSIIFEQSENRLHAQKAIILTLAHAHTVKTEG